MNYAIAEIFKSPQGEGRWAGTYFTFVRFAGCNVGVPYGKGERLLYVPKKGTCSKPGQLTTIMDISEEDFQPDPKSYQVKCTSWDGQQFTCDTNFQKTKTKSIQEIVAECEGVDRVCLTGGEPLIHDLVPLCNALYNAGHKVHIETSGTKSLVPLFNEAPPNSLWITISPKQGFKPEMLYYANEVKLLVDQYFNLDTAKEMFGRQIEAGVVSISPINFEYRLNNDNVQKCLELQAQCPKLNISLQIHKILGCR